jgi:hypothetical protein
VDLSELFEGRKIILPNVSLTMQYVSTLSKDGFRDRKFEMGSKNEEEAAKAKENDDSEENVADDFDSKFKRHEHLTMRVVVGPLKAHLNTNLITQALLCVTKLEKQMAELSAMWVESEERKRDEAPPSVEEKLNKTAAGVRIWYQISVIFSGVNIKADCPTSVLLVRVSDLMLEIGNEAVGHQQNLRDATLHVRRSFRDFYLTFALPELSVWLMSPTVKYREQAHDLIFAKTGETDGIYLSFMTHASVSNFYVFDKYDRGQQLKRHSDGGSDQQSSDADEGGDVRSGGERDANDLVSLADVLQNVVVQIHNTILVVQPQVPIHVGQMLTHYLSAANDFRRGVNAVIDENSSVSESTKRIKEAVKSAKQRAAVVIEEEGLSSDNAGEFLWSFLQNFSITIEIANLGVVVPFKSYQFYVARQSEKEAAAAGPTSTAADLNKFVLL